jgi:hypothetical protein
MLKILFESGLMRFYEELWTINSTQSTTGSFIVSFGKSRLGQDNLRVIRYLTSGGKPTLCKIHKSYFGSNKIKFGSSLEV